MSSGHVYIDDLKCFYPLACKGASCTERCHVRSGGLCRPPDDAAAPRGAAIERKQSPATDESKA